MLPLVEFPEIVQHYAPWFESVFSAEALVQFQRYLSGLMDSPTGRPYVSSNSATPAVSSSTRDCPACTLVAEATLWPSPALEDLSAADVGRRRLSIVARSSACALARAACTRASSVSAWMY